MQEKPTHRFAASLFGCGLAGLGSAHQQVDNFHEIENPKFEARNPKQIRNLNLKCQIPIDLGIFDIRVLNLFRISDFVLRI